VNTAPMPCPIEMTSGRPLPCRMLPSTWFIARNTAPGARVYALPPLPQGRYAVHIIERASRGRLDTQ
jgi:hypothetical protein